MTGSRPPRTNGSGGPPSRPRAAGERRRRIRRRRLTAAGVAALVVVACVVLAAGRSSGVASNVQVAGVDLSRPEPEARAELLARARALVAQPIDVRAGGTPIAVVRPSDLGARPLVGRTLDAARRSEPNIFIRGARALTGAGPERQPLLVGYPTGALERWVARVAETVDRPARSAHVVVRGTRLSVMSAQTGWRVDQARLVARLSADLASLPAVLRLPIARELPAQGTEAAERAAEAGRDILSRPATVRVGGRTGRIPRGQVADALRFVGSQAVVSPAGLRRALARAFSRLQRPARSAHYLAEGEIAALVPARPGVEVDAAAVARGLEGPERPVRAGIVIDHPRVSTAAARALGIRDRIGIYTTPFVSGEPRVTNIERAAEILDGTIIHPGERMSLNAALGERTKARGFVEAPMIADSLEVLAVGGGVSQVSTTLYNAAFEAGLDIPAHRAHGLYIGRYPVGRDATISWGDPDLVIHNDWPHAVLIHTGVSADAITVSLYSRTDGRRVETTTGEPFAKTKPPERLIQNPDLDPKAKILVQKGSDGFSVDVTRTVYRDDEIVRSERFTTSYRAYPKLYAVGLEVPGGEAPPKAPES